MFENHEETIRNVTRRFKEQKDVIALIVGGSVAHGFAGEKSDVDIMILVSDEDYKNRMETGNVTYHDTEDCTYDEGYIDGKYVSVEFLKMVAEKGSEPARFAFQDAVICFSKTDGLEELLESITKYPAEHKDERIRRFYAQFEAWNWYCNEAVKRDNRYLLDRSVSNIVLFGGRMILAHNEKLYPYHKWFLRVLQNADRKPHDLIDKINDLLEYKTQEKIEAFHKCIVEFNDWELPQIHWPTQFMMDSELNWLDGYVPIADI